MDDCGFLEAVCVDPHDVAVRLIYADWLEEQGEAERTEFIRIQVELEEIPPHLPAALRACKCRGCVLRRRERELELAIPRPCDQWPWLLNYRFRRGFIEEVVCQSKDWLKYGPAIVRSQPILEARLSDPENWPETQPVGWARGSHPVLGLEALPPLLESSLKK